MDFLLISLRKLTTIIEKADISLYLTIQFYGLKEGVNVASGDSLVTAQRKETIMRNYSI